MSKKKYNSITFHQAAAAIVEKYFGEIPGFELETTNKIRTYDNNYEQIFLVSYEHRTLPVKIVSINFFITGNTPTQVLERFEKSIRPFFFPEEKITIDSLSSFDYPF